MIPFPRAKVITVSRVGADAGRVLRGAGLNNKGLRLRVTEKQSAGSDGPLRGAFVILDAGDNKHSSLLADFLDRPTDAPELLAALRRDFPGCVNVANMNILVLDEA